MLFIYLLHNNLRGRVLVDLVEHLLTRLSIPVLLIVFMFLFLEVVILLPSKVEVSPDHTFTFQVKSLGPRSRCPGPTFLIFCLDNDVLRDTYLT